MSTTRMALAARAPRTIGVLLALLAALFEIVLMKAGTAAAATSADGDTYSVSGKVKLDGKTFTLPDGFTIERVAGPPLVDRPVEADFDEQGNLYVTDSSGSSAKPDVQLKERPHRVVRLTDTDGDGIFDKQTVFADKMMFPEGAMWRDGSFYVAAPVVLEAAIYAHPAVSEAAVFGIADERLGEVPAAVIWCEKGGLDAAALEAFLLGAIAKFKVPERIWVSPDPLPKLGTGKIDKVRLRAHYRALTAA